MTNVGIIGGSGYTGAELTRILCNHPKVKVTLVTSRQYEGQQLSSIYPHLLGKTDLTCTSPDIDEVCNQADLFFTAVPHKTAMEIVPALLSAGKKVIDLSADFRLSDQRTYEKWYQEHTAPDLLKKSVYGLPEIYREQIKETQLVANPGCYPTSIILALTPLLESRAISTERIIADSKSGTSGAGRAASVGTLYCEVADGFKAYKVADHRHTPEIEQELSLRAATNLFISFTPHLLPISRGILSTIYADLEDGFDQKKIEQIYSDKYHNEPFVRIRPENNFPATQYVRGSNYCDIGFKIDERTRRIIIMSAIDNIGKGAAGQAVQNMNLMLGLQESLGLEGAPFFP